MEGLLWFLILGALFYFMMRFGCGAHMVHGHEGHGTHSSGMGGSDSSGDSIDPVCGMTVAANQGYGRIYQGSWYRFCSRDCLDKFEADPAKYLTPAGGDLGDAT